MSGKPKPVVVTLCGSTRFQADFERVMTEFTLAGVIVISVGVFVHAIGGDVTADEKRRLDELHLRKIDLADVVFVINPGGYIGESTAREIAYAEEHGKPVQYLQETAA